MKKLALDLDALRVESFATEAAPAGRGTVRGHDSIETENCTTKTTCITERFCPTRNTGALCCLQHEA
ncbi:MAG TPA: hypothetical protein VF746_16220 [Longimicrobium sp.]|jgi:hypothetical protein